MLKNKQPPRKEKGNTKQVEIIKKKTKKTIKNGRLKSN